MSWGCNLLYETRATGVLRQLIGADPGLARDVLGDASSAGTVPMLFTYAPSRLYLEVDAPAADGFGQLTVSLLDASLPIPLLRYQTGDVARLLDAASVADAVAARGLRLPGDLPRRLVAVRGRSREALPNGTSVALYKDVVYADAVTADRLTGAVRLTFEGTRAVMHVQLVRGCDDGTDIAATLTAHLPVHARPHEIVVWPYDTFPFGMSLDYERKFTGYVAP